MTGLFLNFSVLALVLHVPIALGSINCAQQFTQSVITDSPAERASVDNAMSVVMEIPRSQSYPNNPLSVVPLDFKSQFFGAVPPWNLEMREVLATHFRDYFSEEIFNNPAKVSYRGHSELLFKLIVASHGWARDREHRHALVIGSLHGTRREALSDAFLVHTLKGRNIAYLREQDMLISNGELDLFDDESAFIQVPKFIFSPVETALVTEFVIDTGKDELLHEGGVLKTVSIASSFPGRLQSFIFSDSDNATQRLTVGRLPDTSKVSDAFRQHLDASRQPDPRLENKNLFYRSRLDSVTTTVPIYYEDESGTPRIVGRISARERTMTRLLLAGNGSVSWTELAVEFSEADLSLRGADLRYMRAWLSNLLALLPPNTRPGEESQLLLEKTKLTDRTIFVDVD